ncbi:MAG: CRP/FNR family cyclic AMP-dependent transcriptional regulator [Sulfurimonas sp.]|jgi:CRP/FNR family cyclic AMP-dependent transcriptional regulator
MKNMETLLEFFNLSSQDYLVLEKICKIKVFKKDDVIFYQGEKSSDLLFVVEGYLGGYYVDDNCRDTFLHLFKFPGLVSEPSLLEGASFSFNVKAFTPATIIYIDFEQFKKHFFKHNHVLEKIIKSLCGKLDHYLYFVKREKQNDSLGKVCHFIDRYEYFFSNYCYQKDVAFILNLTPQVLSQHLKRLKDENIVEKDGFHCKLIDKQKLLNYTDEFSIVDTR